MRRSLHCLVFMGFPTFLNFHCPFDLLILIFGYLIFYILPFMTYAFLDVNLHAPLLWSTFHCLLQCSVLSRRSPRTIFESMNDLLNLWWWWWCCQWVKIWGCEVIFGWPLFEWILRNLGGRYILPDRTWIFFLVRYHWVLPMDPLKLIIPQLGVPKPGQESHNSQGKFLPFISNEAKFLTLADEFCFFFLDSSSFTKHIIVRLPGPTGCPDLSFSFPWNGKIPHPRQAAWSQPINRCPKGNKGNMWESRKARERLSLNKSPWNFVPIKLLCRHATNPLKPATNCLCSPYKFG